MMAEAAGMELAVASGVFGDGYQLIKSGTGKITKWADRTRGLKLLKNLPKGPLEAFVFGEDDVTPELLAALSLGETPGIQLSMIALLKARVFGDMGYSLPDVDDTDEAYATRTEVSESSLMDGEFHDFFLLCSRQSQTKMRVSLPGDERSFATVSTVVVIAFSIHSPGDAPGLVVRSQGKYYYCEHRWGKLQLSDIDVPMSVTRSGIDVDPSDLGSRVFFVSPKVLKKYSCYHRLCMLGQGDGSIVMLLALSRVAKELGEEFRTQSAGDGIPLLSKQHLRDVHNNRRRCSPSLKMPMDEELRTRVEEATARLPLCDRDAGLVLFGTMQGIISDFVKNIESEAKREGNVGVRPYKKKRKSNLVSSSIVQAVGMDATFAIFDDFRKHQVNVAISPGCTAVYFPALSLTVALPEGFEVQSREIVLRPACPFTSDLQESLPILLGLAPKLAENTFAQFVRTLCDEFAGDPALTLSPVTEAIVRVMSPRGRPRDALYLTDLFDYLKKHNPETTWGEASVAGILSQLGLTYSMPPCKEGCAVKNFPCFFQVCREVWPSTCLGAKLVVDCGVDISGCEVSMGEDGKFVLVRTVPPVMEEYVLTGEVANVPWDELSQLRECVGFLHRGNILQDDEEWYKERVRIPVSCRVIGFGSPPTVSRMAKLWKETGVILSASFENWLGLFALVICFTFAFGSIFGWYENHLLLIGILSLVSLNGWQYAVWRSHM